MDSIIVLIIGVLMIFVFIAICAIIDGAQYAKELKKKWRDLDDENYEKRWFS